MGRCLNFWRDQSANIATLFALLSPLLIGAAALAVDSASLYLERRQLQGLADLAAIHAAGDPANAQARVLAALADSNLEPEAISFRLGRYSPDPALLPAQRFVADAPLPNAVSLTLVKPGRIHFASVLGIEPPAMSVTALASATPLAAYSVGSRLASLDGGVLNALLGGLLGTNLSLSLADYRALAALDIELLGFLDALAGRVGVTAGTYGDLLDTRVRIADIALALASAANGNALLLDLGRLADQTLMIDMARLVTADGIAHLALGTSAALDARISVLQILSVAATIADGDRHIALGQRLDVVGLAQVGVDLVIGEPPQGGWFTFAGEGSYVRTAQLRLRLAVSVQTSLGLTLVRVNLPVYVEAAHAEAQLASLSCPPGRPEQARATIAVRPGVVQAVIGQMDTSRFLDTRQPLAVTGPTRIVDVLGGVVSVTAYARPTVAQTNPVLVHFTHADVLSGRVATVSTTTPLQSLARSLVTDLELGLSVGNLSPIDRLLNNLLLSGLLGTVSSLLAPLDRILIGTLDLLGLGIGEADIRVHGFDCRNATLVQ